MKEIEDNIFFESDEEFTDFCVRHYAVIVYSQNGSPYIEGDYSDEYKQCLAQGKTFIIKDEDSVVYERQCVCKRVPIKVDGFPSYRQDTLVQLPVQNMKMYFDFSKKRK